MRRIARGAVLLILLLTTFGGAAGASSAGGGPPTYGPTRTWGGTRIRSLDPAHVAGGSADAGAAGRPRAVLAPADQLLSNETTFTRWAYVDHVQPVYSAPSTASSRVARLTWFTEDGFSSLYVVLRAHWDSTGHEWVRLRVPGRPNGRTGWVRRGALGAFHLTHLLVVVNRARLRMYFYAGGRRVWSAPVAVGKRSTPTPAGRFWINERFKITDRRSGYFPYAFGTTDFSTLTDWPGGGVVGIHGPFGQPQLIPGRISHGCIRLEVAADNWLAAHVQLGTPVHVI